MLIDGKMEDIDKFSIRIDSPALNFGTGFFETLLYEKGKLFFLNDHIKRMSLSCCSIGVNEPDKDLIGSKLITELVNINGLAAGCAKVKIIYAPLKEKQKWNTAVTVQKYIRNISPCSVKVSPDIRHTQLSVHKTLSYMENIILKDRYPGYDEILFINSEGNITEGTFTNILALKNDILYYTDGSEKYLKGIMQKKIIEVYRKKISGSVLAVKKGFSASFLRSCDELILTNSLMVARSIKNLTEGRNVTEFVQTALSDRLRALFGI